MKRIVHLGVGNFHRAHQAWYTHVANAATGTGWRITGVSLRRPDMRDALRLQGYAYTLVVRDAGATEMIDIRVIEDILVAAERPEAVIAAIADPDTHVVTLTVTEKGYDLDAAGSLRLDAPRVAADLAGRPPATTIGLLAAGLARRAVTGRPVTVLCCDNLPDNGVKLGAAVRTYAAAAGLGIADYLDAAVAFPSSMVDRITPHTDAALRAEVAASGHPPQAPVATEGFTEWVIEDRFAAERPPWHAAGAVFVAEVAPFEMRKLRMLNGAHSYLAYAGTLAGHVFVDQAASDRALAQGAAALMDEAAETLPDAVRSTAPAYRDALLARFGNPTIEHRLRQIAMDGSLKLPIRVVPTRTARRAMGLDSPACDAALAAWTGFLEAEFATGRKLDDPAAEVLRSSLARYSGLDPAARAVAVLEAVNRAGAG